MADATIIDKAKALLPGKGRASGADRRQKQLAAIQRKLATLARDVEKLAATIAEDAKAAVTAETPAKKRATTRKVPARKPAAAPKKAARTSRAKGA